MQFYLNLLTPEKESVLILKAFEREPFLMVFIAVAFQEITNILTDFLKSF